MFSCRFLPKILMSSIVPFYMKRVFKMWFLDAGVMLLSHFLKFTCSRRDLPLFQESTFSSITGSLDLIIFEGKEKEGDILTLS